jgi:hypothetical protein
MTYPNILKDSYYPNNQMINFSQIEYGVMKMEIIKVGFSTNLPNVPPDETILFQCDNNFEWLQVGSWMDPGFYPDPVAILQALETKINLMQTANYSWTYATGTNTSNLLRRFRITTNTPQFRLGLDFSNAPTIAGALGFDATIYSETMMDPANQHFFDAPRSPNAFPWIPLAYLSFAELLDSEDQMKNQTNYTGKPTSSQINPNGKDLVAFIPIDFAKDYNIWIPGINEAHVYYSSDPFILQSLTPLFFIQISKGSYKKMQMQGRNFFIEMEISNLV